MKGKLQALIFVAALLFIAVAAKMSGSKDVEQHQDSKTAKRGSTAGTFDTISTGLLSLAVGTNGQFGGGDSTGITGVRMDYFNYGPECDKEDSIPGDTRKYMFDGSVVIGSIMNGDTILSNSMYNSGSDSSSVIYQLTPESPVTTDGVVQTWQTGTMTNHDSSIGFKYTYYAPQTTNTWDFGPGKVWHADQQFITKELRVWSIDSALHENLLIGEVIDWDVPSDSGVENSGEVDSSRNLLYCSGAEYNQDSTVECQDNNLRYGGMAYGYFKRYVADIDTLTWFIFDSIPYGGYHEANARFVDPGWDDNQLYINMASANGLIPWTHSHTDSQYVNLHSALTYLFEYDVRPGDTLVFYTIMTTVRNSADESAKSSAQRIQELADLGRNFINYFGCCHNLRGDMNTDGIDADLVDLTHVVDHIFRGGPLPTCLGEADVNADGSPADISDLTFIIDKIFRGGRLPYSCGEAPCNTFDCHN